MDFYVILGGYKGLSEKYNKIISPIFNNYDEAATHKTIYGVFSLSISSGIIKKLDINTIDINTLDKICHVDFLDDFIKYLRINGK